MAKKAPKLSMTFHQPSQRYFIKSDGGCLVQFPSHKRIHEIWNSVFPDSQTSFFVGSGIARPEHGFYADVGSGTTPKSRARFCELLAHECTQIDGMVAALFIAPKAGDPMEEKQEVTAETGKGLIGDRYSDGSGSWNKNQVGKRQITLINGIFFFNSEFHLHESRRNIVTLGVELMWLIGKEFQIGEAVFRGVKYCDPCQRPSKLAKNNTSFQAAFHDRGGLIAEVVKGGVIRVYDEIIPPPKGY